MVSDQNLSHKPRVRTEKEINELIKKSRKGKRLIIPLIKLVYGFVKQIFSRETIRKLEQNQSNTHKEKIDSALSSQSYTSIDVDRVSDVINKNKTKGN